MIALVRHGQTDLNVQRRWQGSTDEPLNDLGRRQVAESAPALASAGQWSTLITSPLARARQSAEILNSALRLADPRVDDRLVEQHGGDAEAMIEADVRVRWPVEEEIPGVETREAVGLRGAAALRDIAVEFCGASVVIVAHGTLIRLALQRLTGSGLPDLLPNGGFVVMSADEQSGRWSVAAT